MAANRREFLKQSAVAFGSASLALGSAGQALATSDNAGNPGSAAIDFSVANWDQVRAQFPLKSDRIHMAGFLLASNPVPVARAIDHHRQALDSNPAEYLFTAEYPAEQAVMASAARYMNVRANDIALTQSTTEGLGILYNGIDIAEGQEILTTTHDHYVTHTALEFRGGRSGAKINYVSLYDDPASASVDEIVSRIEQAISKKTRVIAITWVHSSTGVKLPVAEIAAVVAEANRGRSEQDRALLCVDGVHGFGVENIDVQAMGCDFFIAGTHKWIFGPRGTGILWGAPEAWPHVSPTIPTFDRDAFLAWMKFTPEKPLNPAVQMTPGGTHAFEHRWAMREAFDFHLAIGKQRVASRIHQLNTRLKQGMQAIDGVRLHTPVSAALSAGIVAFEIDKVGLMDSIPAFARHGIVSTISPYNPSYARLAPGLINTEEEVDICIDTIEKLS